MCTVSFIARQHGCLIAMNRDEKLSRAKGLPPRLVAVGARPVLAPSESSGGTWIALNETPAAFALINWYSVKAAVKTNPVSRGLVVQAVAVASSAAEASQIIARLPLPQINPFRLIGVFAAQKQVWEWRWDLKTLVCQKEPWRSRQWISSGFDEPEANRQRSKTFQAALGQKSAGRPDWLRRLHRSHAPAPGPFSTCMHRADAASVSYTEIIVFGRRATMAYWNQAPCQLKSGHQLRTDGFLGARKAISPRDILGTAFDDRLTGPPRRTTLVGLPGLEPGTKAL